jgi:hypothetical protein
MALIKSRCNFAAIWNAQGMMFFERPIQAWSAESR